MKTKLALASWLMFSVWQDTADEDTCKKLTGARRQFADMAFARYGAELKVTFSRPLFNKEHLQQLPWLERRLIAFHVLSSVYRSIEVAAHSDVLKSVASN